MVTYNMKIDQFSDVDDNEFKKIATGLDISGLHNYLKQNASNFVLRELFATTKLPPTIDWREKGAVTRVKDQKQCGCCWAFSTTGVLEGQNFRHQGQLVKLSEQNLLDCSTIYGNRGCDGGDPVKAYKYIYENKGIAAESKYPYEGIQKSCRFNPKYSAATIKDYGVVNSEKQLNIAVAEIGPISVAVDATYFSSYASGVYYDPRCSSTNIQHAVLVVGYGSDPRGGDFWWIKNSWGADWGIGGYIKLARNRGNHCGVATHATYPLV